MSIEAKILECMFFVAEHDNSELQKSDKREGVSIAKMRRYGFVNIAQKLAEEGYIHIDVQKVERVFEIQNSQMYTLTDKGREYINDVLQYAKSKYNE